MSWSPVRTASLVFIAAASGAVGRAADAPPAPVLFHVAPSGDDRNPGTAEKPFATPERGRDAVRGLRRQPGGVRAPVRVVLHGGSYVLATPLVITPEDSGTTEGPVSFEAAAGEHPVFSGGRRITGWKDVTVGGRRLSAAEVPEVRAGRWYFHQLWVNGQRATRARHPNHGAFGIAAVPEPEKGTRNPHGNNHFQFTPGELKAFRNLKDVDVVVLHLWVGVRLPVESLDEAHHTATFAARSGRPLMDGPKPARYWVENALELLDTPGEWYLDRTSGMLYYWPQPGQDMTEAEVIAPVLPQLLRLDGRPEARQEVAHVSFRGLTFAHTEAWPARTDPVDTQAAAPVPAAVQADGAVGCAFEDCTLAHLGGYAVHLARGCREDRVVGCDCFDLGAGGIKLGEMAVRDDPAEQTHDIAVTDNHVHDGGHVFPQGVGVWVGQSYGNRIAHNHIHDLDYTGISCGWTWGYGRTLAHDNIIEANHVHDIGRGILSDMGAIYTLGVQPGTVVRGNLFHDIGAFRYGGWGIYFDEGTTGVVAENNIVFNTTHGGFHQHYGKDNVVRNNVFARGRDAQLQRSRVEPHRSFTFEHNLVYFTRGKLLEGKWDDDGVALDNNLYWRTGGKEVLFGKLTWEQWRARGRDRHSLIADPRFVDGRNGDFRLREDSPAGKVGFRLPDLAGVGPRPPGRRGIP
jgi:hypothetical protein